MFLLSLRLLLKNQFFSCLFLNGFEGPAGKLLQPLGIGNLRATGGILNISRFMKSAYIRFQNQAARQGALHFCRILQLWEQTRHDWRPM